MTLTLGPVVLHNAGVDPGEALVIRHAYVREHEDTGMQDLHADSTYDEILQYTGQQSAKLGKSPVAPPRIWVVFVKEGGNRARRWSVVENRGETSNDGEQRTFDLVVSEQMSPSPCAQMRLSQETPRAPGTSSLQAIEGPWRPCGRSQCGRIVDTWRLGQWFPHMSETRIPR